MSLPSVCGFEREEFRNIILGCEPIDTETS